MTFNKLWAPQAGPQAAFIQCPIREIFFGGARGGGKTDATLGRLLLRAIKYKSAFRGYVIRRELVQLEPLIARSKELYGSFAKFNEQKKIWTFRSGGQLLMRPIEKDADAAELQGASATDVAIEELGNFPDLKPLLKLKGILRSTKGVPTCWSATGNPGGVGHGEVKRRYIDPAPNGWEILKEEDELTGLVSERIYIPSRITDNKLLMENDPHYLSNLAQTGSEALVRAWLDGDFSQIEGAYFSEFSIPKHVIAPMPVPKHWTRFIAADWGSATPYYVGWYAVASEDHLCKQTRQFIPKGAIVQYRELYGSANDDNVGIKDTSEEIGRKILKHTADDRISYAVLDPSAFNRAGGPSNREKMQNGANNKIIFRRADNTRVGKNGAMGGWDTLRGRLKGSINNRTLTVVPQLYFFSTCKTVIRVLPLAQHDGDNPEDLMLVEDHALDALRYAVMSRPTIAPPPKTEKPKSWQDRGLIPLFEEAEQSRERDCHWRV